jgi:ABC-2 type transport system permease protein
VIGAVAYGIRTPDSAALWFAFVVSVLLAEALAFAAAFAVGLTVFWLIDANGVQIIYGLSCSFFSGYIVPLNLFPGVWHDVVRVLPFASMLQVPIDVFLGKFSGAGLFGVLALQAAWVAVAIVIGRVVLAAATRKVVIQGG